MNRNTFRTAALAATLVCSVGLAACGGSSSESADGGSSGSSGSYCDKVKSLGDFQSRLNGLDASDMKGSIQTITDLSAEMKDVTASAPAEVKADWEKVSGVFNDLSNAMAPLKDLDLSDPTKVKPEQLTALQALAPKLSTMQSDLTASTDAIDLNTTKECGFSLGAS
jgi:hypothetical protein